MSAGKLASQSAHAAVEAYCASDPDLIEQWRLGQHYTKLTMQARDEQHLYTIQRYLADRGVRTKMIFDEGATEIEPHQATALGVVIVDKDDPYVEATFSTFQLYRDIIRVSLEVDR